MIKKRTPRDYKFIRLLGEGSFSSVYLAVDAAAAAAHGPTQRSQAPNAAAHEDASDGSDGPNSARALDELTQRRIKMRKYAIKVCQKSHIKRQGKQVAIMREKEIMNILNQSPNEHFIRLYCTFQDMERLFFVMSYAENGELLTYMLKHPLNLDAVRRFSLQLVLALEHLHKLNVVHRDLKPENILLDERLSILISDFGSAQIYQDATVQQPVRSGGPNGLQAASAHTTTAALSTTPATSAPTDHNATPRNETPSTQGASGTASATNNNNNITGDRRNSFVGTAQYVSPEMLAERCASNKSDLWALGVIVYQMATNVMPFDAPNEYLIYKKIQSLDYTFPEDFDGDARHLVTSLVQLEPNDRLGAQDDLRHANGGYKSIRTHPFLTSVTDAGRHPLGNLDLTDDGRPLEDPDLCNLERIAPGLDETQMLRLLTDG